MGRTHQGPFLALELVSENGHHARQGFWVRTGNRFAYAIGRPDDPATAAALGCPVESVTVKEHVGKTLEEAMKDSPVPQAQKLAILGSYIGLAGEIFVTDDQEAWRILNSTHPGLVDCHLVGEDMDEDDSCCSVLRGESSHPKVGDTVEQIVKGDGSFVRKWKVVELSDCSLPFVTKA